MSAGIYINGDSLIGGRFSANDKGVCSLHSVFRSIEDGGSGKLSIGIDLEDFRTESFFTQETEDKKVREIEELQKEYLQGDENGNEGEFKCVSEKSDKGTGLLFLQAAMPDVSDKACVYPAFVGLYALAHRESLIASGSNLLILFFIDGMVMSVAVEGERIVFARKFPDNEQLAMNVKISSQSVFFVKQRHFIAMDKILVISSNNGDLQKLENISGGAELHFLDISGNFVGSDLDESAHGRATIAYGMSLAPRIPQLAVWNLMVSRKSQWEKSRWCFLRLIVLILLGIPVILGAEIITNKMLVRRVDDKAESIEPLYRRVAGTVSVINQMKSFAKHSGREIIGPDICFNIFSEIDKARSNNLWLTSIAGDPYKTISLNGVSADYPAMLKFLEKLALSKKIKNPQLVFANLTDKGRVEFQVILSYKFDKAFSAPKNNSGEDQGQ